MNGNKPRRGLASFLSNELKEAQPKVLEVPVSEAGHDQGTEAPTEAVKTPRPRRKKPVKAARVVKRTAKKASTAKTLKKAVGSPRSAKALKPAAGLTRAAKKTPKKPLQAPLYLRLTRKEARLREDQIDALAKVTRRLSRAKVGASTERLTENTLLRVAVDLLLAHADELSGTTESQLRASVLGK